MIAVQLQVLLLSHNIREPVNHYLATVCVHYQTHACQCGKVSMHHLCRSIGMGTCQEQ